ncbi:MAG: DUF4132 domain-containing protein [Oscillospiraceae bacterium]|nr:DUF4132 domain-containing protein [Oscillospiraceae bacterium]
MNIHESMDQKRIRELLESFRLSPKNTEIGIAYLTGDTADDTLLQDVEPVSFKSNLGGSVRILYSTNAHIENLRKSDPERMERIYKLFWAMGKSTVGMILDDMRPDRQFDQELPWRIDVLGKPAVAAMELERLALGLIRRERLDWLYELAQNDPEVLEEAQKLKGTAADNMKTMASALVLRYTSDPKRIQYHSDILLENNIDTLPTTLPKAKPEVIQALADYIRAGDLTAPLPGNLPIREDMLSQKEGDPYLVRMLGFCSFLAMAKDNRARCALNLYLRLNPAEVIVGVTNLGKELDLVQRFDCLLADTPLGDATWLQYLAKAPIWIPEKTRNYLMGCCTGGVAIAMKYADPKQAVNITAVFPDAEQHLGDPRENILRLVLPQIVYGRDTVRDFLMGEGSLKNARNDLKGVETSYYSPTHAAGLMVLYRMETGWDNFLCRCAAVLGLVFDGRALENLLAEMTSSDASEMSSNTRFYRYMPFAFDHLEAMIDAQLENGLPLGDVLSMMGKLFECTYNEEKQNKLRECAYRRAAKAEFIPDLVAAGKTGNVFARQVAAMALNDMADDHPEAKAGLLAAAGDSAKQMKAFLLDLYARRPDWAADYEKLLSAKKAAEKLMAVEVLHKLNRREALEVALETEKNAKVIDAIREKLGAEAPAAVGTPEDIATNIVKGNKLRKLSWLLDKLTVKPRKPDGTEADEVIRNAMLLSYCELGRVGRSDTAAGLATNLDAGDLTKLACEVYDLWFADGAQAKHKWVLSFAAVFGGAAMTPRLRKAIHDWPEHQRGAIACDAVMALALSTDPAAIVIVDGISRKFKFRQVKQAAAAALENAAQELGITAEELADRIVPDLGFGKDGKRVFDYGKRSFTVRLTPTLELMITNDQGKAVKNLPAPGKTDDPIAAEAYEEFKAMKKAIKTTVTAQRARLESALSVLRCWDTDRWNALFVENPIMHQFAMSLVWGVYEDGTLTDTFRYMEDGTFNTVDEEEYTLPENAKIGLVHPVELDDETLDGWKQQLEDYEIKQSIEQLSRPIYAPDAARAGEKTLEDFGGKMLNALSLSGKLLQQGWYRGSVQDGGMFDRFFREDATLGIGAELRFSGTSVGYDDGGNVTVYDAIFYTGTVKRGSYVYDTVPEEHILSLGDVPARYYSEIIYQLTRATASSTETNGNWKKER